MSEISTARYRAWEVENSGRHTCTRLSHDVGRLVTSPSRKDLRFAWSRPPKSRILSVPMFHWGQLNMTTSIATISLGLGNLIVKESRMLSLLEYVKRFLAHSRPSKSESTGTIPSVSCSLVGRDPFTVSSTFIGSMRPWPVKDYPIQLLY